MERFSERLKLIREHLHETQKSMSKRFSLGENTWQAYELHGKLPKGETLVILAEMGFDVNWLLTGGGSMLVSIGQPLQAESMHLTGEFDRLIAEAVEIVERWLTENGKSFNPQLKGQLVAMLCRLAIDEAAGEQPRLNLTAARHMMWFASQINQPAAPTK